MKNFLQLTPCYCFFLCYLFTYWCFFYLNNKQLAVGTNPITLAAPGKVPEDHFVLDMATSAVALGKVSFLYLLYVLLFGNYHNSSKISMLKIFPQTLIKICVKWCQFTVINLNDSPSFVIMIVIPKYLDKFLKKSSIRVIVFRVYDISHIRQSTL